MLDADNLAEIEQRILDAIAETEQRILDLEEATKPIAPDKSLGRLTRLEAMSDKAVNEAALSQSRAKLNGLELALTKIYDPGFGICVTCQKSIPIERLLLLPEATRCVECAAV